MSMSSHSSPELRLCPPHRNHELPSWVRRWTGRFLALQLPCVAKVPEQDARARQGHLGGATWRAAADCPASIIATPSLNESGWPFIAHTPDASWLHFTASNCICRIRGHGRAQRQHPAAVASHWGGGGGGGAAPGAPPGRRAAEAARPGTAAAATAFRTPPSESSSSFQSSNPSDCHPVPRDTPRSKIFTCQDVAPVSPLIQAVMWQINPKADGRARPGKQ